MTKYPIKTKLCNVRVLHTGAEWLGWKANLWRSAGTEQLFYCRLSSASVSPSTWGFSAAPQISHCESTGATGGQNSLVCCLWHAKTLLWLLSHGYVFPIQLQTLSAVCMVFIMETLRVSPTPLGYIRERICPWVCLQRPDELRVG